MVRRASVRQGQQASLELGSDCEDATTVHFADEDQPRRDLDDERGLLTVSSADLEVGTHRLIVDCGSGQPVEHQLTVFRQTGARRGGAASVVTGGVVGLGSSALLLGLPGLVAPLISRRRSDVTTTNNESPYV